MTAPPRISRTASTAGYQRAPSANANQATERFGVNPAADDGVEQLSLSITQVLASMCAAVTAALIGSRLGVAGTLVGAGLASVVTVVGSAVLGHSILVTRKQVKKAVRQVRRIESNPAGVPPGSNDRTELIHAVPLDDPTVVLTRRDLAPAVTDHDFATRTGRPGPERSEPGRPRPTRRRVGAGLLVGVVATVAIFISSLAAVTLVETVKGSPLSGGDSGGLSVLGGGSGTSNDPAQVPAPSTAESTQPSATTQVSTVTQTVTSEPANSAPATSASSVQSTASSEPSSAPASSSAGGTSGPKPAGSANRSAQPAIAPPASAIATSGAGALVK